MSFVTGRLNLSGGHSQQPGDETGRPVSDRLQNKQGKKISLACDHQFGLFLVLRFYPRLVGFLRELIDIQRDCERRIDREQ
jgi:hypothetical protein